MTEREINEREREVRELRDNAIDEALEEQLRKIPVGEELFELED